MCHAILRVAFKNDKTVQNVQCDTASAMRSKISELQANEQVCRIGVFVCQQHITRVEQWSALPYTPAEESA